MACWRITQKTRNNLAASRTILRGWRVYASMADALERFFNWQTDSDWWWGPFVFLRPPQNVRVTVRLWLKMFGLTLLFTVPVGAALGILLVYYDYTTAQHHEAKIPPVAATETWINTIPPVTVLTFCFSLLAAVLLSLFPTQWAWNRRADRLNREASHPQQLIAVEVQGVWPPPPTAS